MARFNPKKARREAALEWIGGRFAAPAFVTGEGEPYRPEMLIWLDDARGTVVYVEATDPRDGPASLGDALERAIAKPADGPKRRPTRVRVARSDDAAELRARFGRSLEVVHAPTPEVSVASDSYAAFSARELGPDVWLDTFAPDAPEVARFFEAARRLYEKAPWETLEAGEEIRVDVPALGVHGACASLLGATGESVGFLLFPSVLGLGAFVDACAESEDANAPPEDFGTTWLALDYDKSSDVPRELRKRIAAHGLPLAAPDAIPWPERLERDGASAPLSMRDLELLGAVANALAELAASHAEVVASLEPFSVTVEHTSYPPVRLSLPYEQGTEGEEPAPPARLVPGRRSPAHDVDELLMLPLLEFAKERFGERSRRFTEDLEDRSESLAVPWIQYVVEVEGRPVFEHFLDEHAERLAPAERAWLEAQRGAWLSFWEITRVEPGRSLTLRDLLSGETRVVAELAATHELPPRGVLCGRVVGYGDHAVLCGLHPRALGPAEADLAVQGARARLRKKRAPRVAPEALRPHAVARVLVREWERAVAADDARRAAPPKL